MKTCACVGASEFNAKHFSALYAASSFDAVFAVDGGFAHLEKISVKPDMALGDFDSLGYVPQVCPVIKYPVIKDKSDMELAFDEARERGYDTFFVYGALAGRLDHAVANLELFARFSEKGAKIIGIGDDFALRFLTGPDTFTLQSNLGQGTVSVFSASDISRGVSIDGLAYKLHNAELTNRTTLGLSNELIGKTAQISVEAGTLMVFYPLNN